MMNRLYIILATIIFIPCMSFGQNTFSIGPRIGVNFANVSNLDGSKTLTGLVAGLTSTYSISQSNGITMDLLYSQEGYNQSNGNSLKLDYVRIPVYFNMFFGQLGESFRPKINVGIAPGFLLAAKSPTGVNIKNDMNSSVISLTGGMGFNYRLSNKTWLNIDLRSFLGLSDIRSENSQSGNKLASRNIQLSAGVTFGL